MSTTPHATAVSIHKGAYIQTGDPGAVGAKILWIDTTSGYVLKKRNDTDTGWDTLGTLATLGTVATENTVPIAKGGTQTSSAPTTGTLLIGKTDGTYAIAGLTAGTNVTITPGDGSITIAATGGGGGGGDVDLEERFRFTHGI